MSAAKICGGSILLLGVWGTLSYADPATFNNGSNSLNWNFWFSAGRSIDDHAVSSDTQPTSHSERVLPAAPSSFQAPQPAAPVMGSWLSDSAATVVPTASLASLSSMATAPTGNADAFINFGSGPFPEASIITSGGAQPWFLSPAVEKFFGGHEPNSRQQSAFENAVLQDVQSTFQKSGGLDPTLTIDPSVHANHTLSVVSHTSYAPNPDAIGITDVGRNGFSFIDKLNGAQTLTDLEWAVAHNVSHELMHAFGVATHYDQTGKFLDSATATWSLLTDPNTTFSQAAIDAIRDTNFALDGIPGDPLGQERIDGDLEIAETPVPEPATILFWIVLAIVLVVVRHRRSCVAG